MSLEDNYGKIQLFFNNHVKNFANESNDSLYDEKIYYLDMLSFRKLNIQPSPFQRLLNDDHIDSLFNSIKNSNKIHHNFIVFDWNNTFTIADGIHRYEALTDIPPKKLKTIFALVKVYEFKKANEQNVRDTFNEINNILPLDKQIQVDCNSYADYIRQHFNDNYNYKDKQVIKTSEHIVNEDEPKKFSNKKMYEIDSYALKCVVEKYLVIIKEYTCEEVYQMLRQFNDNKIETEEYKKYRGVNGNFDYEMIKEKIKKSRTKNGKHFCLGLYFPEVFEELFGKS
jgi:hypothetical protein